MSTSSSSGCSCTWVGGERGDVAARYHRLGHDVHLLLEVVDLRRVLDDLLLVELVRLDLLLVLFVECEQALHLLLDVDALLLLELLRGAQPVDETRLAVAAVAVAARIFGGGRHFSAAVVVVVVVAFLCAPARGC